MSLLDIFHISKIKEENETLKSLMTPELQDAVNLTNHIKELQNQEAALNQSISEKNTTLLSLDNEIADRKKLIISFNDDISVQDFALYQPRYSFANSTQYKDRLAQIRDKQKDMIRANAAATGDFTLLFNNSKAQGTKVVKDMQKLLIRAFNSECDEVINNVKYNNYDMSFRKITNSANQIAKLGQMLKICITTDYYNLKIEELQLALEFQIKKQEEKEEQRQLRAEERERVRLERELEEQRKKIEKEQSHYQKALLSVLKQLEEPDKSNDADLLAKRAELENQLGVIDANLQELDYREANQKAGYVYIISNIGSFGKDVYKIGMTRRLEPMERVYELGDASVPFNFDVHAMIFTDDAPKLEAALHRAFEDRKLNMVNTRREFFNVTLDEIKEVIMNNYDKTVEFVDVPDASQYRISQKMKSQMAGN
nr:MAG TPA: helicase [Caudoviricetes sp.]